MPTSEASALGTLLRDARERSGLDLKEISERTKISSGLLKALEAGELSRLPGGLFSRSFVRAYASEVGLEPEATVEACLKACPELRPDQVETPRLSVRSPENGDVATVAARLAIMSVPVVVLLLFFGLRSGRATQEPGVGGPASERWITMRSEEEVAASPLTIDIYPSGPCWVSLTADGEEVLAGVVAGTQRRVFQAAERFVLSVGDAGLFDFSINQEPGRSLGGDGQMVTIVIDRDNYRSFVLP